MQAKGALPDHEVVDLINADMLPGADPHNAEGASLDLVVSDEIYRTDGTFLPEIGETVREALQTVSPKRHLAGTVMEVGVVYIAKLRENSNLPPMVYGYSNPKSTSGRNRVHVRLQADGVPRYDSLPLGNNRGELWVSIAPQAMPVVISEGEKLNQLRFFTGDTRLDEVQLSVAMSKDGLLFDKNGQSITYDDLMISDKDGSILLTLDLSLQQVGWQSHGTRRVLDFSNRDFYEPTDFFEPLFVENGAVRLKKDTFYILQSWEYVRVPPTLACEMVPMDERSGDFRSHEAGFIDPGWGWGKEGEIFGRPLTLEVIPFEDLIFRHRQAVAKIRFETLRSLPHSIYQAKKKGPSNYGNQQSPWLSKHFKQEKQILA
jgi:dCTP deaminase